MRDILNQFISNLNGQFVEVSSISAPNQCFDLSYCWIFKLDIPKITIQHANAYEIFTNPNATTRQYFDIFENTIQFIPQAGDIFVIGKSTKYPYGHTGIVIEATQTKMKCFEQNFPIGTNAHIQDRNCDFVIGFLRPKVKEIKITDQTILPIYDVKGNAMEVQAVRSTINDQERKITNLMTENERLLYQIDTLMTSQTSCNQPGHVITEETTQPTSQEETTLNSTVSQIISRWIKKILGI